VVYPEGVWYERLTPLVLERIIEEHLLGGHTVRSHVMMGSRAPDHHNTVLPALDITRWVFGGLGWVGVWWNIEYAY
jgi:(2Fe-2S) ferredoxin